MRTLFLSLALAFATVFSIRGDDTGLVPELLIAQAPAPAPAPAPSPVDPLEVKITGPEMVEVGDLVVLDASASNADAFVWMLAGGSTKQFAVSKDGTMIYFAAKNPGQYIFHAALAKNMASGKPPALTMVEKVVVVHAVTPPPGPTPTPGPSPAPSPTPLPAGKFDLANFTRTTVFSNVPSEKRGACVAFAGNYSSVAAQIQSGSIKTLADAIAKLKTLNQGSSGADKDFWATNVFAPLSTKLNAMTSAGTLKTSALADWQEAFVEIGAGFAASSN